MSSVLLGIIIATAVLISLADLGVATVSAELLIIVFLVVLVAIVGVLELLEAVIAFVVDLLPNLLLLVEVLQQVVVSIKRGIRALTSALIQY